MCNICYAQNNGISMIDTNTATLCPTHYQEWSEEKTYNDR